MAPRHEAVMAPRHERAPLLLDGQRVLPRPRRRTWDGELLACALCLAALAAWAVAGGVW